MSPFDGTPRTRSTVAILLSMVLVLGVFPGVVAAESRAGGAVVVAEGETIGEDLEAFGGDIVIMGTVDGDVSAFGGNIRIEGEVTGDVEAFGGNVWIAGPVGGDVEASAGNVYVQPGAEIGGSLSAAAGNVVVAGSIGGNAELAGGTVTLTPSASIGGNVQYAVGEDGQFANEGAAVGGTITRVRDVDAGPWEGPQIPGWTFGVYGFLVNLALGAVLLLAFPRFSAGVAEHVGADPLRTGGIGLLTLVAVPVALVLVAITIVGIPLAIVGGLLFGVALWVALVYGRFAVGAWLLSLADVENRWGALVLGLVLLGLAARIPWVGGLVDLLVALLGLGAVASLLAARYRGTD